MSKEFYDVEIPAAALTNIKNSFYENFVAVTNNFSDRIFCLCLNEHSAKTIKTYQEYSIDVSKTVSFLKEKYRDCEIVAVISKNNYSFLVTSMAAWLCGKILCPLNPNESAERLEKQIKQLNQKTAIFCFEDSIHLALDFETACYAGQNQHGSASHSDDSIAPSSFEQETFATCSAYVFTSGSTGFSKVAQLTEKNILSNVDALISHHRLNFESVIATPLPLFHVNALFFSFLCSFFSGGKLVLFEKTDPLNILDLCESEGTTILSVVPSILQILALARSEVTLSSLKYFVSAAAPLSTDLLKKIMLKFNRRVIQGYGLSEAVNFSLLMPVDLDASEYEERMLGSRYPSIGTELPCNRVVVLGADNQICDENAIGELAVKGSNVMSAYKDQVVNPFTEKFFKTGDLGYFVHDSKSSRNFFYITGRSKDVIKRFGETISLREVDELIHSLDISFLDAICVAFENTFAVEELGLVCKITEGISADWKGELVQKMNARLPVYLRPHILLHQELEIRTASGKPLRWKFKENFSGFKNNFLGPNTLWI